MERVDIECQFGAGIDKGYPLNNNAADMPREPSNNARPSIAAYFERQVASRDVV
jgi:hypothetical protein